MWGLVKLVFTGLDLEMVIPPDNDYHYVLKFIWNLMKYIFHGVESKYSKELETVKKIVPSEKPVFSEEPLIIEFKDCVSMLNEQGHKQEEYEDFSTENEKSLGMIVKKKYGVDLFVVDKYPSSVRPF